RFLFSPENNNIEVDMLITVDIMDHYQDDNIPTNVKNAINFRQVEDVLTGEDIEFDDESVTNSADRIVKGATHTSIDNDLSGYINSMLWRYVNGVPASEITNEVKTDELPQGNPSEAQKRDSTGLSKTATKKTTD